VSEVKEVSERPDPDHQQRVPRPAPGLVATRLVASLKDEKRSSVYIALSDTEASDIAAAVSALFPAIPLLVLPPWDCLPYDRLPPSSHCMGRRMDALRIWNMPSETPKLLVTSLEAVLQRIPPVAVIQDAKLDLVVGTTFDRAAFSRFIRQTGYVEEGVADDPGEVVVREGVIDIYPAGAPGPLRVVQSKDDELLELRGYDRVSQRTESFLDSVTLGPATEAIKLEEDADSTAPTSMSMERLLCRLYENMPPIFDVVGDAQLHLTPRTKIQVNRYFDIIEDARQSRRVTDDADEHAQRSLYLSRAEWEGYAASLSGETLDLEDADRSQALQGSDPRTSLTRRIRAGLEDGQKVVITGTGPGLEALCRRAAKATGTVIRPVDTWDAVLAAENASLLKFPSALDRGFIDAKHGIIVVAAPQMSEAPTSRMLLAEPELQIGDVVVHEDHGVGVLKDLERLEIEGVSHDAARLEYRDGGSILVPMEEFGKLWRYGSEAGAVTLDRLHTEAWQKKREQIDKDIRSTARYLAKIAKQRRTSQAEKFVPPQAALTAFIRRFPYLETQDQTEAINAVLSDLASGRPMNRLICGDVGFGKTEIALRAAAAVALSGGQVAVVAPTTVLARQHFNTFQERFAGTGVSVAMLSRLNKPSEAKDVKEAIARGDVGIVVATQAILSKDVAFARLALLIVDEEHRFGLKQKEAMKALAPSQHVLAMSATPIPRTLQSAMVGIQDTSLLATPPRKRLPVRTALTAFDSASLRTGLMREFRRGGQSFVVVPRIEDIDEMAARLGRIVPELSLKIAHGKMPATAIDEAIVAFAAGDGDVLLATNIIENGLDIPRANTMFVWRADLFGIAQLHQLRGRVGRSSAQGVVTLLTDKDADQSEEARLRLSTLVENDRLGSGVAISLRDLDLRGAGDLVGEDQAGHIKAIGVGLYQKLLAEAVAKPVRSEESHPPRAVLNLGVTGTIPADYVSDPALRLTIYARLLRATSPAEIADLEAEFEDRFGDRPAEVDLLLRTTRLQLSAARLGLSTLEAGPKALAVTLGQNAQRTTIAKLVSTYGAVERKERLFFQREIAPGEETLRFFELLVFGPHP
jgi:transcription-repair coupling factor (superfamily II helicase)